MRLVQQLRHLLERLRQRRVAAGEDPEFLGGEGWIGGLTGRQPEFEAFQRQMLQKLAASLEVPYDHLIREFPRVGASYTAQAIASRLGHSGTVQWIDPVRYSQRR